MSPHPDQGDAVEDTSSVPHARAPGEVLFCLLVLMGSLVLAHQAWTISGFSSLSSAGVLPMLAAATMVLSGLWIFVGTLRTPPPRGGGVRAFFSDVFDLRLLVVSLLIVGYLFALQPLGFVPSSFLFLALGMSFLHRGKFVRMILLSAASVAVIYFLFRTVFMVVLPRGVFF